MFLAWNGIRFAATRRSSVRAFLTLTACLLFANLGCGGKSPAAANDSNPIPTLTILNPATASVGSGDLQITATGLQFLNTSAVQWNGQPLVTTFVSTTSLQAQVPASDLLTAGEASVTVANPAPGGGASPALSFVISSPPNLVPVLNTLTPASATAGGAAFTLTLSGTGFITSSQVNWNGAVRTTTFVSSTQLTAMIQASDIASAGSASVTVVNPSPGGGASQAVNFAINNPPNPAPVLSTLAPAGAVAGGPAFTLTLTGSGFLAGSQVNWNGAARPTSFLSSTQLTAAIEASDIASAGSASVTVVNPAPGGGTSQPKTFSVTLAGPATNLTVLDVEGSDLIWNQNYGKIYVSVPGDASANPNTITIVDPVAGTIQSSQATTSTPQGLSLSDDNQFLYATLHDEYAIQRFTLPGLAPDLKVTLGKDALFGNQLAPVDVKVQPGAAHTFAVSTESASPQLPSASVIEVYDDAVPRANSDPDAQDSYQSLQWKQDGTQIYALEQTSPDFLKTFSVNQAGVSPLQSYGSAFLFASYRLHLDPATSYIYSDLGEVVNGLTGLPVGNYAAPRVSNSHAWCAIDSKLQRVFFLTAAGSFTASSFQIQVYDLKKFTLLGTLTIPDVVGGPANLVRWGTSGLAFVTNGLPNGDGFPSSPATGKLYLIDGGFVNPAGPLDSLTGTALNPTPVLTTLSPLAATVNGGSVTLTLDGQGFTGQSLLQWNGSSLATTPVSSTQLTAVLPAADLAMSTQAAVTVSNSGPGGGTSNVMYFAVNPPPLAGNQISVYPTGGLDLAWDSSQQRLYVSMPSQQGSMGNSIASVDPVSGETVLTPFIGSDPAKLSLSSGNQFLYVGLDGQNAVQRLILPGFTPDVSWGLGADSFDGAYRALDLQAAPGSPHATAVTAAMCCGSPSSIGVTVYDDGIARPSSLPSHQHSYYSLQWKADATALYASAQETPTGLSVLPVTASGVSLGSYFADALDSSSDELGIHYDAGTGLLYSDGGLVVNPANGALVANLGISGLALPDSTTNQIFYLGQTAAQVGTTNYTIESFDQTKFTPIASMVVTNVVSGPTAFRRWGTNGIAFTTMAINAGDIVVVTTGPGQLYVISGTFVKSAATASEPARIAPLLKLRKTW